MAPEQCAGDVAAHAGGRLVRARRGACSRRSPGRLPFDGVPTRVLLDEADARPRRDRRLIARARPAGPRRSVHRAARARSRAIGRAARRCCAGSASPTVERGSRSADQHLARWLGSPAATAELADARGRARAARAWPRVGRGRPRAVGHGQDDAGRALPRARARHASQRAPAARPLPRARGRPVQGDRSPDRRAQRLVALAVARRTRRRCCRATRACCRRCSRCSAGCPRSPMRRTRGPIADPQARRTHAFDALRETLQRLGERHTVVLFLDDMQWVDRDTTTLLADLMRAPDPPRAPARARDARSTAASRCSSSCAAWTPSRRSSSLGRCPRTPRSRSRSPARRGPPARSRAGSSARPTAARCS